MKVRIDRAGRIVVPKPMRDALGLGEHAELEVTVEGGGLRLDPVSDTSRAVIAGDDGLPVLAQVPDAELTDETVRALTEELRR